MEREGGNSDPMKEVVVGGNDDDLTPTPAHMIYEKFRSLGKVDRPTMPLADKRYPDDPLPPSPRLLVYDNHTQTIRPAEEVEGAAAPDPLQPPTHTYINWPAPSFGRAAKVDFAVANSTHPQVRPRLSFGRSADVDFAAANSAPPEVNFAAANSKRILEPIYEEIDGGSDYNSSTISEYGSEPSYKAAAGRKVRGIDIPPRMAPESINHFLNCIEEQRRNFGLSGKRL